MSISQENRMLQIETVLGPNRLILTGVTNDEAISAPFSYWLDLISESRDIALDDLVGTNVTFSVSLTNGQPRYYNGLVNRFMRNESTRRGGDEVTFHARYKAEIVPWLVTLSRNSNCRIFQNQTVPRIIEQIFTDRGVTDYEMRLITTYAPREYCVQYRESDYDFIQRLMSYEGIFYFFTHENGRHRMIIADAAPAFVACPNQETARFAPVTASGVSDEDVVTDLQNTASPLSGRYTVNDFNFETPNSDLSSQVDSTTAYGQSSDEIYDYPAVYTTKADGERIVNIRIQQQEVRAKTISGISNCRAFACGTKFGLREHPESAMNIDYLLTTVHTVIHEPVGVSERAGTAAYENRFTCIPMEVPFRPPLITSKPFIQGIQTAFVVGPTGEEIYTDEYGRIKVQFHWDRLGQKNENSSCFMRVAQTIAGVGFGHLFIPRIGQEVIVSFLEGDPDRPVVTGCLYNASIMPPYALPDYKTISTIKTRSTPDSSGYNELRFDDSAGKEQIYLHAQGSRDTIVEGSWRETVGGDKHQTVKGDKIEKVESNCALNVEKSYFSKVKERYNLTVEEVFYLWCKSDSTINTQGNQQIKSDGTILLEGRGGVTLKYNDNNFITIDASGVTIKGGPFINMNPSSAHCSSFVVGPVSHSVDPDQATSGRPPQESEPGSRPVAVTSQTRSSASSTSLSSSAAAASSSPAAAASSATPSSQTEPSIELGEAERIDTPAGSGQTIELGEAERIDTPEGGSQTIELGEAERIDS